MNETAYIYLDNNATTPCAPEVVVAMAPYFAQEFGNPASPHPAGAAAAAALEGARSDVARATGAPVGCVVFTSGATEANNIAVLGLSRATVARWKVVVSAVEHKSVLLPAQRLGAEGYVVVHLPVNSDGVVSVSAAGELIDEQTALVSVQAVNNETGVVQPVQEIATIAHKCGALFHCDAAQMLGKLAVNVQELGCDLASFSAHKVYGPKGVGALYLTNEVRKKHSPALTWGGGQERGIRPGTVNVAGAVGFAEACKLCSDVDKDGDEISALRQLAEEQLLLGIQGSRVNGQAADRVPGTISLTTPYVPADMIIANLDSVCVGEGSACNSGAFEPSHVLLAMGLSRAEAECTIRISLGRYNDQTSVERAVRQIITVCKQLRNQLNAEV